MEVNKQFLRGNQKKKNTLANPKLVNQFLKILSFLCYHLTSVS